MIMKTLTLFLAAIMLVGCSDSKNKEQLPGADITEEDAAKANEVLVEVNGHTLLLKDAVEQIKGQMGAPPTDMPKGRVDMIHKRALGKTIDAFVTESLLADAAKASGIEVTQEDQDMALKKIKEQLPPDKTLEEFLGDAESQAQMKEAMIEGIRVQKLLAKLREENGPLSLTSDEAATDDSIDAYLKANPKATQSRDEIINHLRRQQERQLFMDYIRTLHDAADIKHAPSITPPKPL
jgi:hypothetical protein